MNSHPDRRQRLPPQAAGRRAPTPGGVSRLPGPGPFSSAILHPPRSAPSLPPTRPSAVGCGCVGSVLEPSSQLSDGLPKGDLTGVANSPLRMMYRDSMTYLPDDILCKVDRAAMASSLETRVPFLDHRVAELAWQLPLGIKIMNGQGKWPLRQVLYKHVPRELIDRPKAGFGIPVGQWLRGPLQPWAENLLDQNRLSAEGYFYSEPIRKKWAEHLSGRRDHTASLWSVLMFQAWLQQS